MNHCARKSRRLQASRCAKQPRKSSRRPAPSSMRLRPGRWSRFSFSPATCPRKPGADPLRPDKEDLTMLVLTRKSQESVMVGGSVGFERVLKVTVLDIQRGKVRLGFDADDDVPVHRSEVWEQM